ncbi:MAG: DUF4340 domain-containing protein [Verrucomicrobiae bacterium]|nr:DUF4340 domain-containing protein [Verrucomicrobiae bacterium]MDW8309962.1 DUF4340 domain-containing protein [Verrucomicrobiales bacterium]
MTRKQVLILLVLVVVVGGAGWWLYRQRGSDWAAREGRAGARVLENFPVNDVATIRIRHDTNEVTLAKKDDLWRVRERGDYPANFSDISALLLKLRDLKVVQQEQVGASQLPRLQLAEGQGTNAPTLVEFRDASGQLIRLLRLGKLHARPRRPGGPDEFGDSGGWPDGRYVTTGNDTNIVLLVADPLSNVEPKPANWLNKDFFRVEKARSLAVTYAEATNSWKLTRESESATWQLADAKDGETLDTTKLSVLANPLAFPGFLDVSPGNTPEELSRPGAATIEIETFDHFRYTVRVGQKPDSDYLLTVAVSADLPRERTPGQDEKPEDKERLDKEFADRRKALEEKLEREKAFEPWTFQVAGWVVEPLLKKRGDLLAEKKETPATN